MHEQPRNISGPASHVLGSRQPSCGHISIGKRQYNIALAPDIPSQQGSDELCRFVLDGRTFVVAEAKIQHNKLSNGSSDDVKSRLTGRELEIAVLVAQGYATKNIAYKLQISEWTVSTYLCRAFAKLGVNSRAAMVYRLASMIDTLHGN
jgi:DNA-binding CsgD family transcriptional regulator